MPWLWQNPNSLVVRRLHRLLSAVSPIHCSAFGFGFLQKNGKLWRCRASSAILRDTWPQLQLSCIRLYTLSLTICRLRWIRVVADYATAALDEAIPGPLVAECVHPGSHFEHVREQMVGVFRSHRATRGRGGEVDRVAVFTHAIMPMLQKSRVNPHRRCTRRKGSDQWCCSVPRRRTTTHSLHIRKCNRPVLLRYYRRHQTPNPRRQISPSNARSNHHAPKSSCSLSRISCLCFNVSSMVASSACSTTI